MKKLEKLSAQIDQCLVLAAGDEMLILLLSMVSLEVSRRIETRPMREKIIQFDAVARC
ncbi:hypothetical protein [Bradyrhizobium prioriisuperbiae]|uniref:hypothetical protein n=1 Tax=Bradyrhizobium prioriisuperbiae TaxID=2854389 RepID=UPI0028F0A02B|nr:hypothetical protein [Bradyrhizobium prioritasuperba]